MLQRESSKTCLMVLANRALLFCSILEHMVNGGHKISAITLMGTSPEVILSKTIFLIRATTSAERYSNEEQNTKIMKPFLSIKPGATFFLSSSQTLVYHKDSIEVIYCYQSGKKSFYTHVYIYIVDDTKVTLYADWGDYFLH